MVCEEKVRLTKEYQNASIALGHAIRELVETMKTTPKDEYERLLQRSDQRRIQSDTARQRLKSHVDQHGC
jgi:hypothetical protein